MEAKEGIYQQLTAGGVPAFEGTLVRVQWVVRPRGIHSTPGRLGLQCMRCSTIIGPLPLKQTISVAAGVADLIHAALQQGLRVAVASSGSPEKIRHNLSSSGLWGLVEERLVRAMRPNAAGMVRCKSCACLLPWWPAQERRPTGWLCMQVVSAKYVARGKPAPDVYLEALRRLGCQEASR